MDTLEFIMRLEDGDLDSREEYIDGFASLIKSGTVWHLQGSYQRTAHSLIEQGFISRSGEVLCYPEDD